MKYFSFTKSEHLKQAVCKKVLGYGGFANVKLYQCNECHDNQDNQDNQGNQECNQLFVLKEMKFEFGCWNKEDMIKKYDIIHNVLINEYNIGSKLDHPNIMKVIDIDEDAHVLMIEHITGMDVLDYMNLNGCGDGSFLITHFYYVLDALSYMHNIGIAHRDIKLENIFLDLKNNNVKLIDFGQSYEFKKDEQYEYAYDICGTEGYFPPEYYNQLKYMPDKVDVWCCGVVLYNLVFDCMPWEYAHRSKDDMYAQCYVYLRTNKLEPNTFNPQRYKIKATEEDIKILNEIFMDVFHLMPSLRITIQEFKEKLSRLSMCKIY